MKSRDRRLWVSAGILLACWAARSGAEESPAPPTPPAPAAAPAGPAAGVPRVEIEKDTIDLGTVVRGTKAEGTFVLWNRGDDVLKVLSARPG